MQITGLETVHLSRPLRKSFGLGDASSAITKRDFVGVLVYTNEGISGLGQAIAPVRDLSELVGSIRLLGEDILGEDPMAVERIWKRTFRHAISVWADPSLMGAIAGIDIALWDIVGKVCGQPLYRILGGYRKEVPCYASGGYYIEGRGIDGLVQEMNSYVKMGFRAVKMKVGRLTPEKDAERVRAVREAVGEEIDIMCDANKAWTPSDAVRFGRLVSKCNVRWLEEPTYWYDYVQAMRIVKDSVHIPIAGGSSLYTEASTRDMIGERAVDIVQTDACAAGGVTPWRRIAAMAYLYHLDMAPHHPNVVHMHLVAAAPNGLSVEVFPDKERDPFLEELYQKPPTIHDAMIQMPTEPGIGFELNPETVQKYKVI